MRVGVVGPAGILCVSPTAEVPAADDHGLDQPIDVALDARQVFRVSGLGEHHRLQADDVGVVRFHLAHVIQAALNQRIVRLDTAVQQGQQREGGTAARLRHGVQAPFPFAAA